MAKNPMQGKTVAVIGGGPAGSFVAYLLSREGVRVGVYEPRPPRNPDLRMGERRLLCTGCAGLVQQNALGLLKKHNITIPASVIETRLTGAAIHFPQRSEPVNVSSYSDTITVYRGFGPVQQEGKLAESFDAFLLNKAKEAGAIPYQARVKAVDLRANEEGKVHLIDTSGVTYDADLIIGSFGHNAQLMNSITYPSPDTPPFSRPGTQRASVREYYFGEEKVKELLGDRIHVFGNPTEAIWFAAFIPKRDYVTSVIMGRREGVEAKDFSEFFRKPQVRDLLGDDLNRQTLNCACFSVITLKSPTRYMICDAKNRTVMVNIGDAGPTRPRKNGIFAALDSAEHLASTLLEYGNNAAGLEKYCRYIDRIYVRDNYWSELVLRVSDFILGQEVSQRATVYLVRKRIPLISRGVSSALDHVLTGKDSYWRIPVNVIADIVGGIIHSPGGSW